MLCRFLDFCQTGEQKFTPEAGLGVPDCWSELILLLSARSTDNPEVEEAVAAILQTVRENGDEAVVDYTRRFDCPNFLKKHLRVAGEELENAALSLEHAESELISEAIENIRTFHRSQMENSWFLTREDGSLLGQRVVPVERAGLYVPGGQGGQTPLISTLLMTAIPALVAGVPEIAVVSPPDAAGRLNKYLMATAHMLGLKEVYAMGSAWAVAALGYGTQSITPVDVIAGPGNIYVTTAKKLLMGQVGIDMLAGPSEILILADKNANPAIIAADMLSQAEHDPLASAVCLSNDADLLKKVAAELKVQLKTLPRADIARRSLADFGALALLPSLGEAVRLCNNIAPEHLELLVDDPWGLLPSIKNAGAVFMGQSSPEALGDYFAGPNHVLPTMRTARFSSALSVQTFCKKMSIINASATFAGQSAAKIATLARLEGLEAHARAAELRAK